VATEEAILAALDKVFGVEKSVREALEQIEELPRDHVFEEEELAVDELREIADQAPIVRLVNLIITQAVRERATDIHIEPRKMDIAVRYRVDGFLHNTRFVPKHLHPAITSRIKITSGMNIAERRIPQDGRHPSHCRW